MGDAGIGDQYVQTLVTSNDGLYRSICGVTVSHIKC